MFDMLKDTQNSPSLWFNVVLSLKKAFPGSGGQEWTGKPATIIEGGGRGCESQIFVIDCLQIKKDLKRAFSETQKIFFEKVVYL